MPKYYTPPSRIRFANLDNVAFKKLAMTVESCVQVSSDHHLRSDFYSGVIRFNRNDWKRYTAIWLYGDTLGRVVQEFVQPSIFDISGTDYPENRHLTSPSVPATMSMTGSNFVPGTVVYVGGVAAQTQTVVDSHHLTFLPPVWPVEQANVPVKVVRPDYRSSTNYTDFSYELRPVITDRFPTGSWIDGGMQSNITGTYFKPGSNVLFTSGTASSWSNNLTFYDSTLVGYFSPEVPATGVYSIQIESPSGLISNIAGIAHATVSYHRPEIGALLPFNTGSVVGSTPVRVSGRYFLSGAQVYYDGTASLSQSPATPFIIDTLSPPHLNGAVSVSVVNPQDGQESVGYPYLYVVPIPTISDVNFSGSTAVTRKTGSAGSFLYITGTNFTGSDASMTVTSVTLSSGTFLTASTNFTIISPFVLSYAIPALSTGSSYDVSVSNSAGTATFIDGFKYEDVPIITHVSPNSGTVAGGTVVLIDGVPFYDGASQAKFSGVLGSAQTVYTLNQMSAITPPSTNLDGGRVDVSVQNYGSVEGRLENAFEYVPFPTASYVISQKGNNRVPAESVSTVTLVGTRFLAGSPSAIGTTIRLSTEIGTIPTSFINSQQVSFNVQPHAAGFASLTATNRGIVDGDPLANAIEYVITPTISSISRLAVAGSGTTISVTGTNYLNSVDTAILVGTTQVPATVVDSQHLTFVSPSLPSGTYNVTAINKSTTVSNAIALQYITNPTLSSVSTNQGPNTGGTTVVVNGVGFISGAISASIVGSFVSSSITPTYISPNQFSFITPNVGYLVRDTVQLNVYVFGLSASLSGAFTFEQPPQITSLSPTTALTDGSTYITISGTGFVASVSTVDVNGVTIGSTVFGPSTITFNPPAHVAGTASVSVHNTFLSATTVFSYVAAPPPQISTVSVGTQAVSVPSSVPKWQAENGGNYHINTWGVWGDRLLGANFTPTMSLSVLPFDGTGVVSASFSYQSDSEVRFTMPPHSLGGQGYVYLSNSNGVSNYVLMRWNKIPTLTAANPSFDTRNGTFGGFNAVTLSGTNFTNGEVFCRQFHNGSGSYIDLITIFNNSSSITTLVARDPAVSDQTSVILQVHNSTSVFGESFVSNPSIYKLVNPPNMQSLAPLSFSVAGGSATFSTATPTYTGPGSGPRLHWYVQPPGGGLNDQGIFPLQASATSTVTASMPSSPGSATGTAKIVDGYTNEVGTTITGTGISFTYFQPPPISSVVLTNTSSFRAIAKADGFTGNVAVVTTPYLYVSASGGTPPYTASLQYISGNFDLNLQYAAAAGYINSVRGSGVIFYDDTEQYTLSIYRWVVQDSQGQTAYSSNVAVGYDVYPVSLADGGTGACVVVGTPILMSDGTSRAAEDVNIGELVLTYPQSYVGAELGSYPVVATSIERNRCVSIDFEDGRRLTCSHNHRLATSDGWIEAEKLSAGYEVKGTSPGRVLKVLPVGVHDVVRLTVVGAQTYISDGLLSHNLKPVGP